MVLYSRKKYTPIDILNCVKKKFILFKMHIFVTEYCYKSVLAERNMSWSMMIISPIIIIQDTLK